MQSSSLVDAVFVHLKCEPRVAYGLCTVGLGGLRRLPGFAWLSRDSAMPLILFLSDHARDDWKLRHFKLRILVPQPLLARLLTPSGIVRKVSPSSQS
jgi:hypothetical protein